MPARLSEIDSVKSVSFEKAGDSPAARQTRSPASAYGGPPDWQWQDRNAVRDAAAFSEYLPLSLKIRGDIETARQRFRMKITPYYIGLMDPEDPQCPITKMAIPDIREFTVHPEELEDPTGDENPDLGNQPVSRLVHRYPDRVLLLPTARCGTYCRHCFRRRLAGRSDPGATPFELSAALRYIRTHTGIHEVILSGGDPLTMSDDTLFSLLERIRKIPHVRLLRIHTRMPVVNPFRITPELAQGLSRLRPLRMVLQVNHHREITTVARKHWAYLTEAGIPLLNQSVLLKGVNDHANILRNLGWRLTESGIRPHYLHHLDLARGTGHFRVSIQRGLRILRELQGTLPGDAIPRYVLDTPGGYGKVPLQYPFLAETKPGEYRIETPEGRHIVYKDIGLSPEVRNKKAPEI
jgi:lysine 2,3-aminomutase